MFPVAFTLLDAADGLAVKDADERNVAFFLESLVVDFDLELLFLDRRAVGVDDVIHPLEVPGLYVRMRDVEEF